MTKRNNAIDEVDSINRQYAEDMKKMLNGEDFMAKEYEKTIRNNAINEYVEDMKSKLLNGEDFVINGVGVLRPVYRRVKNDNGRNFTVRVRMDYFWDFYTKIIESCKIDNSKFVRKVRSRNNVAKYIESGKTKECRTDRTISN